MVHGLSCSAACGISPDQLIEPASPALQGRFLTTGPPGKPTICIPESKMFLREELKEGRAKSIVWIDRSQDEEISKSHTSREEVTGRNSILSRALMGI